jgi:Ser/Thr protein kinase RdoA (MazF antagonist)
VLAKYPVGALKEGLPAAGGVMNENWFVDTDTGRYFLKRRNPFFSSASIEFELKLVDYLSGQG